MRKKNQVINTIPPTTDYPFGRIKDDTGVNDGTPIVEANNGDIQETVTGLMQRAKIIPNDLPDNVTNGYQIMNAIRENGGKFNTMHVSTIVAGKIHVNCRLDNVYLSEFLIVQLDLETDYVNVMAVNRIIDSNNVEYNLSVFPDDFGNFFDTSRCIIEMRNGSLAMYPISTRSVLQNVYDRLSALEGNLSNTMRIIESGIYIDPTSRASGSLTITHDVIDINATKLIITCTRADAMDSLTTTNFTYMVMDRFVNQFRIAFNNFPTGASAKLKVEWVLVQA